MPVRTVTVHTVPEIDASAEVTDVEAAIKDWTEGGTQFMAVPSEDVRLLSVNFAASSVRHGGDQKQ